MKRPARQEICHGYRRPRAAGASDAARRKLFFCACLPGCQENLCTRGLGRALQRRFRGAWVGPSFSLFPFSAPGERADFITLFRRGAVFMFSFPHLPSHRLPVPELFSPPMHPRPQHRAGAAFFPSQPPSPKFFFPESFPRSTGRLSTLRGMHRLSPSRFGVSEVFCPSPASRGLIARGAALPNSPSPP